MLTIQRLIDLQLSVYVFQPGVTLSSTYSQIIPVIGSCIAIIIIVMFICMYPVLV